MTRIFVGNIAYSLSEQAFSDALKEDIGVTVESVRIVIDQETQRPRGFGFVDVLDENADEALTLLDGALVSGRPLRASRANTQPGDKRGTAVAGARKKRPAPQVSHRRVAGHWEDE